MNPRDIAGERKKKQKKKKLKANQWAMPKLYAIPIVQQVTCILWITPSSWNEWIWPQQDVHVRKSVKSSWLWHAKRAALPGFELAGRWWITRGKEGCASVNIALYTVKQQHSPRDKLALKLECDLILLACYHHFVLNARSSWSWIGIKGKQNYNRIVSHIWLQFG